MLLLPPLPPTTAYQFVPSFSMRLLWKNALTFVAFGLSLTGGYLLYDFASFEQSPLRIIEGGDVTILCKGDAALITTTPHGFMMASLNGCAGERLTGGKPHNFIPMLHRFSPTEAHWGLGLMIAGTFVQMLLAFQYKRREGEMPVRNRHHHRH